MSENTIKTGGKVFGAFYNNMLVGFASIENQFFGLQKEYMELSCIHTSFKYRGMGIGNKLFYLVWNKAKEMGAEKLYISAHSSQESQAFYKERGCVEAENIMPNWLIKNLMIVNWSIDYLML